jgi:hypothetical protein
MAGTEDGQVNGTDYPVRIPRQSVATDPVAKTTEKLLVMLSSVFPINQWSLAVEQLHCSFYR